MGPPETDSIDTVRTLEKDPRVHFVGFMKDPTVGYAAMDCVVIPSTELEGFSNVILEAGSMELPVVASDIPGLGTE